MTPYIIASALQSTGTSAIEKVRALCKLLIMIQQLQSKNLGKNDCDKRFDAIVIELKTVSIDQIAFITLLPIRANFWYNNA